MRISQIKKLVCCLVRFEDLITFGTYLFKHVHAHLFSVVIHTCLSSKTLLLHFVLHSFFIPTRL